MTTGERIRSARKAAGMTQKELGEKLGLSFQSIAQWENNLRNPKKETLQRIAAALGVSYFDLINKQDRAMYEVGFKEGAEAEEWQHKVIDELWEQEGYSYSDAEIRLINSFSQLNDDGQYEAVKRIEELTEIPRYRRQDTPQTSPAPQEGTDTTPAADGPETAPKDE